MHKHIERIPAGLARRRAHVASLLALALSGYALWLYLPPRWSFEPFFAEVLAGIALCVVLAVLNFLQPLRWSLLAMGMLLILLLAPGPLITVSIQLTSSQGGIASWLVSYSILVAVASVASYLSFKSARQG